MNHVKNCKNDISFWRELCTLHVIKYDGLISLNEEDLTITTKKYGPNIYDVPLSSEDEMIRCIDCIVNDLRRLHRYGISHTDVRDENIVRDGDQFRLIDYDFCHLHLHPIRGIPLNVYRRYGTEGHMRCDMIGLHTIIRNSILDTRIEYWRDDVEIHPLSVSTSTSVSANASTIVSIINRLLECNDVFDYTGEDTATRSTDSSVINYIASRTSMSDRHIDAFMSMDHNEVISSFFLFGIVEGNDAMRDVRFFFRYVSEEDVMRGVRQSIQSVTVSVYGK